MRGFVFYFFSSLFLGSLCFTTETIDDPNLVTGIKKTIIKKGMEVFQEPKPWQEEALPISASELIVDLRNPIFKNGILLTREGGVIKNKDIRIQAKTIQYLRKTENGKFIHKIEAEQDLVVQYKDQTFVGDELEYDFVTKTGVVYNGRTFASPWYLGGEKIELNSDGSYKIKNVYLTTCENVNSSWDIQAGQILVTSKDLIKAENVRFRLFKLPTLWLPSFRMNLKKFFGAPVFRYKANWDKSSGPRISFRYQLYSWKDFALFGRLDYRLKRGFGGAIETEYYPRDGRTTFETKNYLATDVLPSDPEKKRRYRLQGAYRSISPDQKTSGFLTWDKYSDIHMPGDFKFDDFEINTARKTELFVRHLAKDSIGILHARARFNTFESLQQELPSFYVTVKPVDIQPLGLISHHTVRASYYNYVYSTNLGVHLSAFDAVRVEAREEFYRPFTLKAFSFLPRVELLGVYYSKGPNDKHTLGLGSMNYSLLVKSPFYRSFEYHKHVLEPYAEVLGYTKPNIPSDQLYIFNLADGFHRLNLVKVGIKNSLFSLVRKKTDPSFCADLYSQAFLGSTELPDVIPKMYLDLFWNLPAIEVSIKNGWNFYKQCLDFSNTKLGWTISQDAALSFEFRYRSAYDWRKSDRDNFILDVAYTEDTLHSSPLSDKRNTFLAKFFLRLTPYWTCHFESHFGWNRKHEPFYSEYKVDLFTLLSTKWKARVSYLHTQTDDRVTGAIFLMNN